MPGSPCNIYVRSIIAPCVIHKGKQGIGLIYNVIGNYETSIGYDCR